MNIVGRSILGGSLLAGLAACAHAGSLSGAPPFMPAGPAGRSATADSKAKGVVATLVIRVPRHQRLHRSGKYVSPSTQSIVIATQETAPAAGSPATSYANLTAGSPGCSGNGSPYTCTVTIAGLTPGATYTLTFVTYDATQTSASGPYAGHVLAQNTISKAIVAGADNTIGVTLEGVPASFSVAPLPGTPLFGGTTGQGFYFGVFDAPVLTIAALDADGNFIVGPGAPTLRATIAFGASGGLSFVSAPSKGNLNRYIASASAPGTGTLQISAPVPGSSAPLTANIPISAGTLTTTVAGSPNSSGSSDGTGRNASFSDPYGLTYNAADGSIYIADENNCTIRKMDSTSFAVTTVAGTPGSCTYQDGAGANASFNYPYGVAADAAGNVYVADTSNLAIRKIAPGGVVTTLTGHNGSGTAAGGPATAQFESPEGIAFDPDDDDLYVTDAAACTVRRVTLGGNAPGTVTTIAGTAGACNKNGSDFNNPFGLAYGGNGTLYVADGYNCEIRRITNVDGTPAADTVANPLAGNTSCAWADGTGTAARFYYPYFVAYDATHGLLYVSDEFDDTLRAVNPATSSVTTIAGSAGTSAYAQGWSALFSSPYGVTYDPSARSLFVADESNYVIDEVQL